MNVTIIGVPYDLDQPYRGMGKAPDALLDAGLAQRLQALGCATILVEMVDIPASQEPCEERVGQLQARLGYEVARARAAGFFPLVIGGDCLNALGTLAGLLDPAASAVAWFDAHADFNTPETTPSGYLGGMPLACVVGRGLAGLRERARLAAPIAERNVALLGVRELDQAEERALAASSIMLLRAPELEGDTTALERAVRALQTLPQLYLHIDIDVLDPVEAPGVDYPADGGLRVAALQDAVSLVASMGNMAALTLTAVNPEKDVDDRTVRAALDIIDTALTQIMNYEL